MRRRSPIGGSGSSARRARLNHPHFCALFDVGRHEDIEFLVVESLDGETLAARLTRGALPLNEALKHAINPCGELRRFSERD